MCLGVPVKITEINGKEGMAEFKGIKRNISLELLEQVNVGDYVILHAGFAIQVLEQKDAMETLKLFETLKITEDE